MYSCFWVDTGDLRRAGGFAPINQGSSGPFLQDTFDIRRKAGSRLHTGRHSPEKDVLF